MGVKAILPKRRLNVAAMKRQFEIAAGEFAADVAKDFDAITKTWRGEKPDITQELSTGKHGLSVFIGAENDGSKGYLKLLWLEEGTRPHRIYAGIYTGRSTKRVLSFRTGYSAKTSPGFIGSRAGGSSGPLTKRPYVNHPGTQARNFEPAIANKRYKLFKKRMTAAMAQAAKVSGHAMK